MILNCKIIPFVSLTAKMDFCSVLLQLFQSYWLNERITVMQDGSGLLACSYEEAIRSSKNHTRYSWPAVTTIGVVNVNTSSGEFCANPGRLWPLPGMWSSGKRTFVFLVCENGLDIVGIITTPVSFSRVTARHLTSNMHQLDRVDFTVHWCVENSWPIAISVHANMTWYFNWKEGENTDVRSRLRPWQWCSSLQKDGW